MAKVDIAIDKITKVIDKAIEERDFLKMMETHDFIEGYVEKDRFRSFLKLDKEDNSVLELTKDFQMITLNVEEMKKVLEDLKFLESENWKLPF
ncbi:Uncharacterised protein [uncultured Clostridium sp.]|uniref:hypothetical protein n=1 Tax=uncultured Clostridium sp. TaxID=59620 RepID=UPI00082275E4|nr:hypothetical protein [uncultured Clostridium sp.]SCJ95922.1 Uncharacterised protein [uncultured Clostridium sp.]